MQSRDRHDFETMRRQLRMTCKNTSAQIKFDSNASELRKAMRREHKKLREDFKNTHSVYHQYLYSQYLAENNYMFKINVE